MKRSNKQSHPAMTLYDHIRELQMRLFVSVIALAVAGLAVYAFYEPLLELLRSPLGAPLYYNTPAGSFAFVMKICFMGALVITTPIIVYNLIMFVRPAFEKALPIKRVLSTTISSAFLAIAGAIFAFTCILPGTLSFFAGFQVEGLSALISADDYLNFVTNIIITFVIVFQLPLLIMFIDSIKPLSPKKLFGLEKWVILGSLIISLLAPFTYDPVTSLLIALPIVVLYNLSIIIVLLKHASVGRRERATAREIVFQPTEQTIPLLEPSFEQPAPAPATLRRRAGIDIKPLKTRPTTVVPATWVGEKKSRQITLGKHTRLISDINHNPNANRVLASQ